MDFIKIWRIPIYKPYSIGSYECYFHIQQMVWHFKVCRKNVCNLEPDWFAANILACQSFGKPIFWLNYCSKVLFHNSSIIHIPQL
uniref:Uncharacterized protein n=1 Tax=Setaria italica TaxID=4555 RepID=K3Y0F8_SETIT